LPQNAHSGSDFFIVILAAKCPISAVFGRFTKGKAMGIMESGVQKGF